MEAIKNWMECIIVVIVMIGIIEIIVSEGETKKFVLLITQITISIVIALPILKFFQSDISVDELFNVNYLEESDFYISEKDGNIYMNENQYTNKDLLPFLKK